MELNNKFGVAELNEILRECDPDGVRPPVTWTERLAKLVVVAIRICILLLLKEAKEAYAKK